VRGKLFSCFTPSIDDPRKVTSMNFDFDPREYGEPDQDPFDDDVELWSLDDVLEVTAELASPFLIDQEVIEASWRSVNRVIAIPPPHGSFKEPA
jgi:hypothetical protein